MNVFCDKAVHVPLIPNRKIRVVEIIGSQARHDVLFVKVYVNL